MPLMAERFRILVTAASAGRALTFNPELCELTVSQGSL
jgi:hypothetical protein